MKIIFVGDIFCGGDLLNEELPSKLIKIPEFYEADFRIANLENPLSDWPGVADKCVIHAPTLAVEYLRAFKIEVVALANNYIQDKEEQGIIDTFDTLTKEAIQYCGAGETLAVACHTHLPQGCIEYNGKKAFMGRGNFSFPNSFIKPPVQIDYHKSASDYDITHGYHTVYKLTHKRWSKWCRRSLVVSFDTSDDTVHTIFAEQDYLKPVTRKIAPFKRFYILTWVYNNTDSIYHYLSDLWYKYVVFKRLLVSYRFYIKQTGLRIFLSKVVNRIKNKVGIK